MSAFSRFNWPTLWSRIHVAITAAYTNFHTVNVVCSSPELAEIFRQPSESQNSEFRKPEDVRRHDYICFAFYVDKFARQILEIDEVKKSINRLHRFLKVLKTVPEIYRFFVE
ncbi:hypothetical protein B9Z55_017242 [Caenorhabditis nigoni]|uniref:Uncharacterized protein n=1 Tax=Caenorhabditis nigoni TaxID=1611254 RepID=A0A2G5T8N5_9PELO|nr:hypothetical protein B9Z55_017242 [Caenorhabditis nigoni]